MQAFFQAKHLKNAFIKVLSHGEWGRPLYVELHPPKVLTISKFAAADSGYLQLSLKTR